MAVGVIAAPRTERRPRELDWRVIAGATTALLGVAGMLTLLTLLVPADRTVVVATRDLVAGTTLGPVDLTVARVRVPEAVADQAFSEEELVALVGRQIGEPIHAQELVTRARLGRSHATLLPGQVVVRLPLKPDAAAVDEVQTGDPVTILGTIPQGKAGAGTRTIVPRAAVVSARHADPNAGSAGTSPPPRTPLSALTVVVTQAEAAALADARVNGELVILLAGPES